MISFPRKPKSPAPETLEQRAERMFPGDLPHAEANRAKWVVAMRTLQERKRHLLTHPVERLERPRNPFETARKA